MQTQDFNNRNFFCFEKSKFKDSKTALLHDNKAELAKKKNKKDKKKKFWEHKQKHIKEQKK